MTKTIVSMAAGFGTRFGSGVKQLEPIGPNGEVLMDYAIHDSLRAGFYRVVFIIRRDLDEMFRTGVGKRAESKCAVDYVYQELSDLPAGYTVPKGRAKPWGTGQAVLVCRHIIDGPFCVLNADDYYGVETFRLIHDELYASPKHDAEKPTLCMAGYVLGNTLSESGGVTRGICRVSADGLLESIEETHGIESQNGEPYVKIDGILHRLNRNAVASMNIWGMSASFMDYMAEDFIRFLRELPAGDLDSEFLLPTVVGGMVRSAKGIVRVLPTADHWFGMTYAQDKAIVQRHIRELIAQGVYPERL